MPVLRHALVAVVNHISSHPGYTYYRREDIRYVTTHFMKKFVYGERSMFRALTDHETQLQLRARIVDLSERDQNKTVFDIATYCRVRVLPKTGGGYRIVQRLGTKDVVQREHGNCVMQRN